MLWVYAALAAFGLAVTIAQVLSGAEHHPGDGAVDLGEVGDFFSLFITLRFWAYFALGTGLVGVLCTAFGFLSGALLTAVAIATGLVSGLGTTFALRALRKYAQAPPAIKLGDAVGQPARVLVAPSPSEAGKVRLLLGGQTLDLFATTDEDDIQTGDEVTVLEAEGVSVKVTKKM